MQLVSKIEKQIQTLLKNTIIINRKYLDDEQLDREEQFRVLKEIFEVDVRDREIKELSSHFAPVFRQDNPIHLSLLGKTGTGKTVTMLYFLNQLQFLCKKKKIDIRKSTAFSIFAEYRLTDLECSEFFINKKLRGGTMNFFKRLGMLFYMLFALGAGALFLLVSLGAYTPEQWIAAFNAINGDFVYQIIFGGIAAVFVIAGVIAPYRMEKKLRKNRRISFQNPDGEVTVSLSAIEDYIRKIAKSIPGIKDIRSRVDVSKKGINITASVSISAAANIPEVTEKIQMQVKNSVQGMLGVEESINIKMHINRIARGVPSEKATVREDMVDEAQVPYREG